MSRLLEKYRKEIIPELTKKHEYANVMEVPKLKKVTVNIGVGEATQERASLDNARKQIEAITGQHAVITKAKKSISNFKLRKGVPIGTMTTLRGKKMYEFVDRLVSIVLPRIRDFNGISPHGFDGRGNYTLGIKEQIVFPEIDYDKVDKVRGLNITFVTSAKTDEEGRSLMRALGMPFAQK
ncbi:MAG TPA: 50S ribosomal protein L5 [Candidatus Cloacimonetes bacterium]|nr:50S ribosomal protein L5 [Candidatus Cloacimonadota bacterium]HEX37887.1 50S ribosomal protein L5 [Candidatus Cloacimonadota bacterium]